MGGDTHPTPNRRLWTLTLYPYLGAGIVACASGLFNPTGSAPLLALPVASSFGACFGLLHVGDFRRKAAGEGERILGPVTRSTLWLALVAAAGLPPFPRRVLLRLDVKEYA
jgi:hypothetical protein